MESVKNFETYFATPIHVIDFKDRKFFKSFADIIINSIGEEEQKLIDVYDMVSTADHLHTLTDFQPLVQVLDNEIKDFFQEYLGLKKIDTHMSCMWANVQRRKSRHPLHVHPNSFWSGVLYLDIPEGYGRSAGELSFVDPRPGNLLTNHGTQQSKLPVSHDLTFIPQTGRLIFFPSWLAHGTTTCFLDENQFRVSLSFNYLLDTCDTPSMKINTNPLLKTNIF
jgi:uncharacterized protein (TIGR02466 family)